MGEDLLYAWPILLCDGHWQAREERSSPSVHSGEVQKPGPENQDPGQYLGGCPPILGNQERLPRRSDLEILIPSEIAP